MLKQRVITAIVALVVVLVALWAGPIPWKVFVYIASLACVYEFTAIVGVTSFGVPAWWGYVVVTGVMWWPQFVHPAVLSACLLVVMAIPVFLKNHVSLAQVATLTLGSAYIAMGSASTAVLRGLPTGIECVLVFMVVIWATDTAAYFGGSWLKGPKLWPSISPKKTVSGSLTGLLGGAIGAVLVGSIGIHGPNLWKWAAFGVLVSLMGQLGDLVESAYKRTAGVKDTGRLLPGHGGVLDRVDSVLFAAPLATWLITQWLGL